MWTFNKLWGVTHPNQAQAIIQEQGSHITEPTNLEEDSTRTIGNRKAGLRYCAEYRQIMGFTPHEMYWLCNMFVNNVVYTKVLEYIFFEKKNNPYGKFKDNLDSSKLHQFWLDNEFEIREFWSEKIKTE